MRIKDTLETVATVSLAICALIVTASVVRREFFAPAAADGPKPLSRVENWERYATGDQYFGPSKARGTIVVFSDFQCPFCRQLAGSVKTITAASGSDIRVYHRNFPLTSIHPQAKPAAIAALCATRQGRFHEYHDYLFEHQEDLARLDWTAVASTVGVMDSALFRSCLSDSKVALALSADSVAAATLKITGTPLVMVNGWLFDGTPSEQQINEVLAEDS